MKNHLIIIIFNQPFAEAKTSIQYVTKNCRPYVNHCSLNFVTFKCIKIGPKTTNKEFLKKTDKIYR